MTFKHFLIPFVPLFLLASCQAEQTPDVSGDGALATVSLSLSVAPEEAVTGATRAETRSDLDDTAIHDLCILQYRGTADGATIVGEVRYLSEDADPTDDEHFLNLNAIRLAESQGEEHTLVFLANTGSKFPQVETLGELKTLFRTVSDEAEVSGNRFRMNGIAVSTITTGTVVHATLRRSLAKVTVNISNDGTDDLVITGARLRNVSRKVYYLTDYRYIDAADASEQMLDEASFQDVYDPAQPLRMDYAIQDWTGPSGGTGNGTFSWLVPANMRGTDPAVTDGPAKSGSPLAEGATWLEVYGAYGPAHDRFITYKFYLGANLVGDFNLIPNGAYTYDLVFSGKGDPEFDSRIEDGAVIDFGVDANCYMLLPPENGTRRYTINVVHRPNIFWGRRYGFDQEYPQNHIGPSTIWHARLIWSDFEMTQEEVNAFLTRKEGTGAGGYYDDDQRIEITIPAGQTEGNVIVGLYSDDFSSILWSWHLWITSYQPDAIAGSSPVDGVYIYEVPGGEIHRYAGVSWQPGGLYEKAFIMDRNVGALSDRYDGFKEKGCGLFYQFGRKDPLPTLFTYWVYALDGTSSRIQYYSYGNHIPFVNGTNSNVAYSVNNPRTFISGNELGTIFSPNTPSPYILWMDPYHMMRTDYEEDLSDNSKSFFDPCPPGWFVPDGNPRYTRENLLEGFTYGESSTASTTVNLVKGAEILPSGRNRGNGLTYYPRGFLADKDNPSAPTVFFAANGYRFGSGLVNVGGSYLWTSYAGIYNYGATKFENGSYDENTTKSTGCMVRCIKR